MYINGTYGAADGVLWGRRPEGLDWVNTSRADVFREHCKANSAAFAGVVVVAVQKWQIS